ncbi:gamma-glutamyltransferase [Okeania sp. SIO2B3]|uniref:gamma-glutamyltransferase n=1 Tax=Okeania sp. SIO2B3 TaxID=2607784 RepID=UPI0013C16654|nr:gamma-glutamyltransferase [Okeania sp. SIO2B3]NET46990.1 gamma-glutamyltransferase [Okeania sp. SIO2B3]
MPQISLLKTKSQILLSTFLTISISLFGCTQNSPKSVTPIAELKRSKQSIVVSAHPLASEAGKLILQKGGNAVDAAIATAFAISVVEPFSAGIGGGGFLLLGIPPENPETQKQYKIQALDFRERAPKAATQNMYLNSEGKVDKKASLDGHLAAGVPGTVAGLYSVHKNYGKLPWSQLLQPAISYAQNGFEVSDRFVNELEKHLEVINKNAAAREIFTKDGKAYQSGDLLIQKDQAQTLETIAKNPQSFYTGQIAQAIANDMAANGGLITLEDLKNYTPIWRKPICGNFRQAEICAMSPPSSGGVHLLQILNIVGETNLQEWGNKNPDTIHLLTEAMRVAYADRSKYLGDPDFVQVPVRELTSRSYAQQQRQAINIQKVRPSTEVQPASPETLERYLWESPDTTHLTVVDRERKVVSMTYTINGRFGAGVVATGTGILLNNEMDDFAAAPGVPNLYGLVGGEANAIAPGKTPLSSMTPTIVTQDGRLIMATGSPGGSKIITTVLQVVLNVLEHQMNAAEAVSAPRFHHQWLPDRLLLETGGFSEATVNELKQRGHNIVMRDGWGNANVVVLDENGMLQAAADPRGEGEVRVGE